MEDLWKLPRGSVTIVAILIHSSAGGRRLAAGVVDVQYKISGTPAELDISDDLPTEVNKEMSKMAVSNGGAIQVGKASVPEPKPVTTTKLVRPLPTTTPKVAVPTATPVVPTAAPVVPTAAPAPPVPAATTMPIAEIVGIAVGSAAGAAVIGGGIAAALHHAGAADPKAKAKEGGTPVEVDIPVYVPIGPTSMRLYKKEGQVAAAPLSAMFGSMTAFIAFGVLFVSISGFVYMKMKRRRHFSYSSMQADGVTAEGPTPSSDDCEQALLE